MGYDEDRQLSIDGELVPKTHNYENLIITANTYKPGAGAAIVTEDMFINQGFYDPDMDYMYQDPEGLFHTCTNQGDVLQQVSELYIVYHSLAKERPWGSAPYILGSNRNVPTIEIAIHTCTVYYTSIILAKCMMSWAKQFVLV